jgi:hypothetical protein
MGDVDLANAIIAAALIQSGEFKLSAFDDRGQPLPDGATSAHSDAERFIQQAMALGDPDSDWYDTPALTALRKLTNVIRRALYEPTPHPESRPHEREPIASTISRSQSE